LLISEIEVRFKKKVKTGRITSELVTGLPVDSFTTLTGDSSAGSVALPMIRKEKKFNYLQRRFLGWDSPPEVL